MGTWEGHISPGVAFYSFGIVFCFQNSWLYFTKGRKFHRNEANRSKLGKIYTRVKHFPLDSFMKIIYGVGAASAELFYPPGTNKLILMNDQGQWMHLNEWQHFTMYSFFAINGVIDIISQKFMKERALTLEKAAVAMAFYITALLLFYHRHGKNQLELESHELLLYTNLAVSVVLTVEVWKPFDTRLIWLHTLLVMQMGSWLFNLAFILFGRVKWDPENHGNLMILPIFYAWHVFFNCIAMAMIHLSAYFYYKHRVSSSYTRLSNTELQCCMSTNSDDAESTSGGTFTSEQPFDGAFSSKEKETMQNGDGYSSILLDDETTFMT